MLSLSRIAVTAACGLFTACAYSHDTTEHKAPPPAPYAALQNGTAWNELQTGSTRVHSVDIYYNAGHPGVEEPHVHVVLFHDETARQRLEGE